MSNDGISTEIDSDAVRATADRFGLDAEKLNGTLIHLVSGGYEVAEYKAIEPGAKDSKKLLGKIKKQASALKQTLNEVPIMSSLHADLFYKYKHFHMLKNEIDDLVNAIDSITPKRKRGGTIATRKRDMFIGHMAIFWWRQTGKSPTYTTDPHTDERTSDFLDFLTTVASLLGIDPAPLPQRFADLKRNEPIYKDLK